MYIDIYHKRANVCVRVCLCVCVYSRVCAWVCVCVCVYSHEQMFLVGSKVCAIYKEKTGLQPPAEVHMYTRARARTHTHTHTHTAYT